MQLDLTIINQVLSNLDNPAAAGLNKLKDEVTHEGVPPYSAQQGEYNEKVTVYIHKQLPQGLFVKITRRTDSYGENETITNIAFVMGKAKTITIYEPI